MPCGNRAGSRLCLCAVEIPLSPEAAAADSQKAAGLLVALILNIVAVVKKDKKTVFHIAWQQVQRPDRNTANRSGRPQQNEPAQGKARDKRHHHENQYKHHGVSHVAGYDEIQSGHAKGVSRRHKSR